ncbi:MAG: type II secretion system major pseudopilin GspG, partial [Gammaproteobacteria bacterium]|nr:type II secretion system major pseudopilin GspG [Gammaproteobacteria bacterium]
MRRPQIKRPVAGHKQAGFTLIEVLVVVVIIGILGAVIVPNLLGRPDQARITAAQSDLRSLSNALDIYRLDNYQYPSTDQGLEALETKPNGFPEPKNYNPEGYIKKLPS